MSERRAHPCPSHRPITSLTARLLVTAATLATLAAAIACGSEPTAGDSAVERRDLAELRAATARFQHHPAALDAGYTVVFLDACMVDESGSGRGGMGFHHVNPLHLNGSVSVAEPEALLYEPGPKGELRLVAVEYVIPKDAWTGTEPPRLFGRDFTLNAFDLWALHVWVWKENPSGLYADWNPRVSCDYAKPVARMSHH